jgi:hypothetical protein
MIFIAEQRCYNSKYLDNLVKNSVFSLQALGVDFQPG